MLDDRPEARLRNARRRAVGIKQTVRAIAGGRARVVFVARDAEERLTREVLEISRRQGVEVLYSDTMLALGRACGIEVGAAAAAVVEE